MCVCVCVCVSLSLYIYINIYICSFCLYRERERLHRCLPVVQKEKSNPLEIVVTITIHAKQLIHAFKSIKEAGHGGSHL